MLGQTRQPMSVFLIPVNQSKQLWHHSTPEYIWRHLPKITKTCQTGYTNHDIIHLKIADDLIFMNFLRILFTRSRQKVMTSLALIYSCPRLMKFLPKKGDNSVPLILLGVLPYITYTGMCRPKGSWFWSSWFRTGYPFQTRFLERGIIFRTQESSPLL